ncbi:hypothetical protein M5K25_020272 [Dendrobium thyrsiflorum]|uniref:Cysteine-rich transmembrane domain-containing protein n=1 Tax=Dendrobium thyrsiflorum TaxID=117978 RepID=A0ABD0U9E8_DENTH
MSSYVDQANVRGQAYPPAEGKPLVHAAPPPMGYPVNNSVNYSQQVPVKTKKRGDGFWKGCCAALCCCCLVDMCV